VLRVTKSAQPLASHCNVNRQVRLQTTAVGSRRAMIATRSARIGLISNRCFMLPLPLPTDHSRPQVVADNAFVFAALASGASSRACNL
jgi:hypothetical protein